MLLILHLNMLVMLVQQSVILYGPPFPAQVVKKKYQFESGTTLSCCVILSTQRFASSTAKSRQRIGNVNLFFKRHRIMDSLIVHGKEIFSHHSQRTKDDL